MTRVRLRWTVVFKKGRAASRPRSQTLLGLLFGIVGDRGFRLRKALLQLPIFFDERLLPQYFGPQFPAKAVEFEECLIAGVFLGFDQAAEPDLLRVVRISQQFRLALLQLLQPGPVFGARMDAEGVFMAARFNFLDLRVHGFKPQMP